MVPSLKVKPLAVAVGLICAAQSALAGTSQADLMKMIEKLNQRMERLEKRNADLEQELRMRRAQQQAASGADVEKRLQALEQHKEGIANGLASDTISENEPELTSRLKAVETQAQGMQPVVKKLGALDGISAGFSLTTVAQRPTDAPGAVSQLNYRADATLSLPLEPIGDIEHKVFAHVRIGQGAGLNDIPVFGRPNSTAFRVGALPFDDSVALLAEAWYQADIPLPFGGFKPRSKEKLEVTFGKMDPFVFFDQNAVAGDESRQFLNAVFVHNPLLDAGGDIGVDANGFTPGLRIAYVNDSGKPESWRASIGVLGAGAKGSNYERSLSAPTIMLQAETEQRLFGGLAGNYRIYAWNNPQAGHFDTSITNTERHIGWGISADQRVGDGVTLFGRYGYHVRGQARFDRALTLGGELNGAYWDRGADALGLAAGWLRTSEAYRSFASVGTSERVAEAYYRYRISKQFDLSPNFQYISHPGGDSTVEAIKVFGLRAQLTY
ncbi:MAG TPA: carbohydrate porin [Noviherbaspirillum sp.]|uniref:carbohydrate porin n=1 Tax=Noviherbaspirillum sp. TaxID=1926288 RepID=UPI002B486BB2|nr:carbohydrate porin [Noviherbaspirillum sp.]HJV85446.1 carbohydrate porin [Noviherbaspirillum sp.]